MHGNGEPTVREGLKGRVVGTKHNSGGRAPVDFAIYLTEVPVKGATVCGLLCKSDASLARLGMDQLPAA